MYADVEDNIDIDTDIDIGIDILRIEDSWIDGRCWMMKGCWMKVKMKMRYFQSLDESCGVIKGGFFFKKLQKFAGLTSA